MLTWLLTLVLNLKTIPSTNVLSRKQLGVKYVHDQQNYDRYSFFSLSLAFSSRPTSHCNFCNVSLFIFTQPIPFAGTILDGLIPGEMILIQGGIPTDSER